MIARKHGVKPENVLVGSGSTQLLRTTTHVFCSKTAGLVAAIPAYEECAGYAQLMGYPVTGVKLNAELKMDLDALLGASKGAGMVFYCNPNNPVATAIGGKATRDYIAAVNKSSPNTTILVDEAYFEYATMPGYETMIPLAVTNPRVVVARTFSKAYGMAGLRVGYAVGHKDAIKKMADWDGISAVNMLGVAAVRAALQLDPAVLAAESKRNTDARAFTMKWFTDRGYKPTDSQTNFIFVDIKRPAADFRNACAAGERHGGPQLPALREVARPHLDRHDGRDAARRPDLRARPRQEGRIAAGLKAGLYAFARGIGLPTATALVVGTIIGSSIFVQASEITSLVPSPLAVVLAWAVAGVLTLVGALVCAELASAYPRTGGVYVFLKEIYSPAARLPLGLGDVLVDAYRHPGGHRDRVRALRRLLRAARAIPA